MRSEYPSTRMGIAIANAMLAVPLTLAAGWRYGRQRLEDEGLIRPPQQVPSSVKSADVVDWVRAFEARHGRKPKIGEVQTQFGMAKTTAWRRLRSA